MNGEVFLSEAWFNFGSHDVPFHTVHTLYEVHVFDFMFNMKVSNSTCTENIILPRTVQVELFEHFKFIIIVRKSINFN